MDELLQGENLITNARQTIPAGYNYVLAVEAGAGAADSYFFTEVTMSAWVMG